MLSYLATDPVSSSAWTIFVLISFNCKEASPVLMNIIPLLRHTCWKRKARNMRDLFPLLKMSYEQISLLAAQLLVYQQYLQKKIAPSVKRNRTLRILLALNQRLNTLFAQNGGQMGLLLTVEEVATIKEALTVLQRILETRHPSAERGQEIQHLVGMKTLIEQTFPTARN